MTTDHALYALALVQLLDVLSTLYAFRNGATEANPIMKRLMFQLGTVPGLLLPKLVYGGAVWYWREHLTIEAVALVCAVYAVVVVNNVRVGLK